MLRLAHCVHYVPLVCYLVPLLSIVTAPQESELSREGTLPVQLHLSNGITPDFISLQIDFHPVSTRDRLPLHVQGSLPSLLEPNAIAVPASPIHSCIDHSIVPGDYTGRGKITLHITVTGLFADTRRRGGRGSLSSFSLCSYTRTNAQALHVAILYPQQYLSPSPSLQSAQTRDACALPPYSTFLVSRLFHSKGQAFRRLSNLPQAAKVALVDPCASVPSPLLHKLVKPMLMLLHRRHQRRIGHPHDGNEHSAPHNAKELTSATRIPKPWPLHRPYFLNTCMPCTSSLSPGFSAQGCLFRRL